MEKKIQDQLPSNLFNLFSKKKRFMKHGGQLWTFEYPNGDRVQIDRSH